MATVCILSFAKEKKNNLYLEWKNMPCMSVVQKKKKIQDYNEAYNETADAA